MFVDQEQLILLRYQFCTNWSIDLTQSQSKSEHLSCVCMCVLENTELILKHIWKSKESTVSITSLENEKQI